MLARLEEDFGVVPSLADLFRNPSVAALAGHIDRLRAESHDWRAPEGAMTEDEEELIF